MKNLAICVLAFLFFGSAIHAQERIGINTDTPLRTLHLTGTGGQYGRIHSTTGFNGLTGIEFVRGYNGFTDTDWRIENINGIFSIQRSSDNFQTPGVEGIRILPSGNMGIGTFSPLTVLHVDGGTQVHNNDGYVLLGDPDDLNLAFDNNSILARNDGGAAPLHFQANGSATYIGDSGGNTYLTQGSGRVGVGATTLNDELTIEDSDFQLYFRNSDTGINDWYLGASSDAWSAGGNQFLFSPESGSGSAVLRLMDTEENDGFNAPVMIHTNEDHTILMDGNEIDTRGTALYINHNTDNNTLINPSGGRVGIGTSNPGATVEVMGNTLIPLSLQRDGHRWDLNIHSAGTQNLTFRHDDIVWGEIQGVTGQWISLSDSSYKAGIRPIGQVLDKVLSLPVYSYSFLHDSTHTQDLGILAQDLLTVFPDLVKVENGQYGVAYAQLSVLALKAIQEQQQVIDVLRKRINTLKEGKAKTSQD